MTQVVIAESPGQHCQQLVCAVSRATRAEGHHSEARPHHHGPANLEVPQCRQTVLIIHAHHHEDHVDPICRCVFHGLEVRCKGKIVADATTYEVVKKIIIPGSADKGSYMETMPGGKHDPQFLVSHWWGDVLLPRWHVCFRACHTTLGQQTCKCSCTVLFRNSANGSAAFGTGLRRKSTTTETEIDFPLGTTPPTSSHWYKLYDPVGTFPAKHSDEVRLNWKAPVGLIIDGPARHATLDNDEIENHLTHGCEVDADRPHSSSSAGSGSDSRPKL